MAQKRITELQLIDEVTDELNLPSDNTIQSYRVTVAQLITHFFSAGRVLTAMLGNNQVTKQKMDLSTSVLNSEISNLGLAASVGSNALTVAAKGQDGNDPSATNPITVAFRSPTLTTGLCVIRQITAALSHTISSGSTAGHTNGNAHWLYWYFIDATSLGGGVELAWSSVLFDEGTVHTTTAEGGAGAADSNRVLYSTTARANVPIRLIGRMVSTQTTAGTWAAVPTEISVGKFDLPKIAACYHSITTQSFSNGVDAIINFDVKTYDPYKTVIPHGSAWTFTAPKSTVYQFNVGISLQNTSAWDLTDRCHIRPRVGGVDTFAFSMYPGGNINNNLRVWGSGALYLAAGSVLDFELEQTSGGSLSLDGSIINRVSIVEVG